MDAMLTIQNHGPLIEASNYWDSEAARQGYLHLSINAGAFRLMVPDVHRRILSEMRPGAKYVVVSFLPIEDWKDGEYCVEWLVEDGSSEPWSCHLSPSQVDRMPTPDSVGVEWVASVWDRKKGRPHKCLERKAYCQIVPRLPWLKRIEK